MPRRWTNTTQHGHMPHHAIHDLEQELRRSWQWREQSIAINRFRQTYSKEYPA